MKGIGCLKRNWQALNSGAVTEDQAGGETVLLHGRSEAGIGTREGKLDNRALCTWLECVCRHARENWTCAQLSAS